MTQVTHAVKGDQDRPSLAIRATVKTPIALLEGPEATPTALSFRGLPPDWPVDKEPLALVFGDPGPGAMYSRNHYDPPLEHEYRRLLDWSEQARGIDVRQEVARLVAEPLPDGSRPTRVVVMGAGGLRTLGASCGGVSCTFVDFDEWPEDGAAADGATTLHAIGLRTVLEPGSAGLVVITSRLRGLWERRSGALLTEARRIGGAVRVAFFYGNGPR